MDTYNFKDYEKDLGLRIRKILDDNKVNRSKFSIEIGITRATLNRYEKGSRIPDAEFIFKFSDFFKINPLWIISGFNNIKPKDIDIIDKELNEIIEYLRHDKNMRQNLLILARQKCKDKNRGG